MSKVELQYNIEAETPNLSNYFGGNSMLKTTKLTQELLKKELHYDKTTGIFTWLHTKSGVTRKDRLAGSPSKTHISITVYRKRYLAHRLAWLYTYGTFPDGQIDHIDGNGNNNSISNLRVVDTLENAKNQKIAKNNKHGTIGIYKNNGRGKDWKASITVNGKFTHLGYFDTKEEAIAAREEAEVKYMFHENHGKRSSL